MREASDVLNDMTVSCAFFPSLNSVSYSVLNPPKEACTDKCAC
jgi:hypothetical protein